MSTNNITIGSRVRFLNSQGGGIVRRISGRIAWVEGEDGFEIPTPIQECVTVGDNDTFIPAYKSPMEKRREEESKKEERNKRHKEVAVASDRKPTPSEEKPRLLHTELAGHDKLNVYLAYLPMNEQRLGTEPYECFLINDSNYCLQYNYLSLMSTGWKIRATGSIDPNTKLFIEEFTAADLQDMERICLQLTAYKERKTFLLKPALSVELRLDTIKFVKLHCFRENDFFEDKALVYPIVEDDRPVVEKVFDPEAIEQAMKTKELIDRTTPTPARKTSTEKKPNIIEIDLHAGELLETTAGMKNGDILQYQLDKFHEVMKQYASCKGQKIVFIYGKGEGVLRQAIEKELRTRYKQHRFQDASFREYGFGATMVIIH